MALVNVPTVTSASAQKQIAVSMNQVNYGVIYTVPAGKTFTGFFLSQGSGGVQINGLTLPVGGSGSNFSAAPVPVTLLAGTVVNGANSGGLMLGTEQ